MSFLIRGAKTDDLSGLFDLSKQFSLLNLPAEKSVIADRIEKSVSSFKDELPKETADYLFVIEDSDTNRIIGSSQIMAKKGTEKEPAYSFKVLKKEHFSQGLGIGFIHQMLRLRIEIDGPSEIGGLIVDKNYRKHMAKIGRMISFARFNFIGMAPGQFEKTLMAEMAPPLTSEGRNEFWEALGRRFTGMPYQEADLLSQRDKEFIRNLFPAEDIYLCLLDSKARLAMGRVSTETQPALNLLERIGFEYIFEVDPFDGGPHVAAKTKNVSLIRSGEKAIFNKVGDKLSKKALVGRYFEGQYRCIYTDYKIKDSKISLSKSSVKILGLTQGEELFVTPFGPSK